MGKFKNETDLNGIFEYFQSDKTVTLRFFSKIIKRVVSNNDHVGGKIVFEILGMWTCLLETLEYPNIRAIKDSLPQGFLEWPEVKLESP